MIKEIFLDTETTGIDPVKNGLIEIGCVIRYPEELGKVEEFTFKSCIFSEDEIDPRAKEQHGYSDDEIMEFPDPLETYKSFLAVLDSHVDKYDPKDKFYSINYSVNFDMNFLRVWFEKCAGNSNCFTK